MFDLYYNSPITIYEIEDNGKKTITQNIIDIYKVSECISKPNNIYYEVINNGHAFKLFLLIDTNKFAKVATNTFTLSSIINEFIKFLSSSKITKIVFNQDYKPMDLLLNTYEIFINMNRCYVIFPYITTNWKQYNIILNKFMSNEHPILITSKYYIPYITHKDNQRMETLFKYIIHVIPREHIDIKYNNTIAY